MTPGVKNAYSPKIAISREPKILSKNAKNSRWASDWSNACASESFVLGTVPGGSFLRFRICIFHGHSWAEFFCMNYIFVIVNFVFIEHNLFHSIQSCPHTKRHWINAMLLVIISSQNIQCLSVQHRTQVDIKRLEWISAFLTNNFHKSEQKQIIKCHLSNHLTELYRWNFEFMWFS